MDKPLILPIKKIIDENPNVKTFYFDYPLQSQPGQFVMLWIPGIDQKPFSVGFDDGKTFGLSIFKIGALTTKLFDLKPGDRVGISGPYGKPFSVKQNTHYIMVAGGYGAAPLSLLADRLADTNSTAEFCLGAREKNLLLFENRLSKMSYLKLHIATNDGSAGHTGFVTDLLEKCLQNNPNKKNILVCTCGPELMEKKVLDTCNQYDVACEISIERYMKCGIGICGQCVIDDLGICMCTDGPVVSRDIANKIKEFGQYHRDKTGAKHFYNT